MQFIRRSSIIAAMTFLFSIAGMLAHRAFTAEIIAAHELILAVSGLVGTLFAIVLGLLISSSYTTFNSHQSDLNAMVSALANIDFLLRRLKSESLEARRLLRGQVDQIKARYWPGVAGAHRRDITYEHLASDIKSLTAISDAISVHDGHSIDDLNSIRQSCRHVLEIQSNIIRSLSNTVPKLLLVVVFGWACLLFFLYGVLTGGNLFGVVILLLGSAAVASTNFLILELTDPYQGDFRVSSSALDLLVQSINED